MDTQGKSVTSTRPARAPEVRPFFWASPEGGRRKNKKSPSGRTYGTPTPPLIFYLPPTPDTFCHTRVSP